METVTRSVKDIDTADRLAIEHVLGKHLSEDQQIVINIMNIDVQPAKEAAPQQGQSQSSALPAWCNVYEGLNEAEIAEIESSIVRSHDTRSFR